VDASTELAKLIEARTRAAARVGDLEQEYAASVRAAREASAALAEGERVGLTAPKRHALEEALAVAKRKADEPWQPRIEGARSAVRDADRAVREHIAGNLTELVEAKEADGRRVAEQFNETLAAAVALWLERERIASEISGLASKVAQVAPGDVSWSKAEECFRAATGLVNAGGEEGPTLTRLREPWSTLLGEPVQESVPA
jgi:hypothetical protein